jgi:hypothetical protein
MSFHDSTELVPDYLDRVRQGSTGDIHGKLCIMKGFPSQSGDFSYAMLALSLQSGLCWIILVLMKVVGTLYMCFHVVDYLYQWGTRSPCCPVDLA